jgi:hypothetical protein
MPLAGSRLRPLQIPALTILSRSHCRLGASSATGSMGSHFRCHSRGTPYPHSAIEADCEDEHATQQERKSRHAERRPVKVQPPDTTCKKGVSTAKRRAVAICAMAHIPHDEARPDSDRHPRPYALPLFGKTVEASRRSSSRATHRTTSACGIVRPASTSANPIRVSLCFSASDGTGRAASSFILAPVSPLHVVADQAPHRQCRSSGPALDYSDLRAGLVRGFEASICLSRSFFWRKVKSFHCNSNSDSNSSSV